MTNIYDSGLSTNRYGRFFSLEEHLRLSAPCDRLCFYKASCSAFYDLVDAIELHVFYGSSGLIHWLSFLGTSLLALRVLTLFHLVVNLCLSLLCCGSIFISLKEPVAF